MSSLSFVPSNALVAAFPLRRRQPSIRMAEVQARKMSRQADARTTVLAEMSVADLLSRGLHNALPAGFISARARIEFGAKHKRGLVVAGKFDRAAIMVAAAGAAKAHQARYGSTWAEAMSVSLKAAWQVAKAAHGASAR